MNNSLRKVVFTAVLFYCLAFHCTSVSISLAPHCIFFSSCKSNGSQKKIAAPYMCAQTCKHKCTLYAIKYHTDAWPVEPTSHPRHHASVLVDDSHGWIHLTDGFDHCIIWGLWLWLGCLQVGGTTSSPFFPSLHRNGPVGTWPLRKCLVKRNRERNRGWLRRCTYPLGRWTDSYTWEVLALESKWESGWK